MNIATRLRKSYTYLRWTLKAPRYAGKMARSAFGRRGLTAEPGTPSLPDNTLYDGLLQTGFARHPQSRFNLPEVDVGALAGKARGMPFFNALPENWERFKPLICDLLRDPLISDTLLRYFDGRPWLWNVALNYSDPSEGEQESQLWHFDYGDVRQLHTMLYFSDVDADSGPFTFFPAEISDHVPRSSLEIERFTDEHLRAHLAIDPASPVRLIGKRGDCFVNDPGRTLHQGARCKKPRLVLFLTFTTPTPMSLGGSRTLQARQRQDLLRYYSTQGSRVFLPDFFT